MKLSGTLKLFYGRKETSNEEAEAGAGAGAGAGECDEVIYLLESLQRRCSFLLPELIVYIVPC
jgi:hypothetical protein